MILLKNRCDQGPPGTHNRRVDLDAFMRDGYVVVRGAFGEDTARACREMIWDVLAGRGIYPDDRASWAPPLIRINCPEGEPFAMAGTSPRLHAAYDELIGAGRWVPRAGVGGTVPVRFPSEDYPGEVGYRNVAQCVAFQAAGVNAASQGACHGGCVGSRCYGSGVRYRRAGGNVPARVKSLWSGCKTRRHLLAVCDEAGSRRSAAYAAQAESPAFRPESASTVPPVHAHRDLAGPHLGTMPQMMARPAVIVRTASPSTIPIRRR